MIHLAHVQTLEWATRRLLGIGASESAVAAGLSRWETPRELYMRKRGELPTKEVTRAMRLGLLLEPAVAALWAEQTGKRITSLGPGLFQHARHPCVLASPDAQLESPDELAEFKTTTSRNEEIGEEGTDELPTEWLCQAQQQMAVMDATICWFGVLVDGRDLKCYRVDRSEPLIDLLIEADRELWRRIELGEAPEIESPTYEQLRRVFRRVHGGVAIELSWAAQAAQDEVERLNSVIRRLEEVKDQQRAIVLAELGEAESGLLPGGTYAIRRSIVPAATIQRSQYVTMRKVKVRE